MKNTKTIKEQVDVQENQLDLFDETKNKEIEEPVKKIEEPAKEIEEEPAKDEKTIILEEWADFYIKNVKGKSRISFNIQEQIHTFKNKLTNKTGRYYGGCSTCVLNMVNFLNSQAKSRGINL